MNKTSNYQLNQWDKTDRIMMEDFNADNAKLDAALESAAAGRAALDAAVAKLGNCQVEVLDYTGTGGYGSGSPNTLTFSGPPKAVFVFGYRCCGFFRGGVATQGVVLSQSTSNDGYAHPLPLDSIAWSGNQVSWYSLSNAKFQLNENGDAYWAVGFIAMDE